MITAQNTIPSGAGDRREAHARVIGLEHGVWPHALKTNLGNGKSLARISFRDDGAAIYRQVGGHFTLIVHPSHRYWVVTVHSSDSAGAMCERISIVTTAPGLYPPDPAEHVPPGRQFVRGNVIDAHTGFAALQTIAQRRLYERQCRAWLVHRGDPEEALEKWVTKGFP